MDSSQSSRHNGINATTQESTGRIKKTFKNPLFFLFDGLRCSHETEKCARGKKEKKKNDGQKVLQNKEMKQPMTLAVHCFLW